MPKSPQKRSSEFKFKLVLEVLRNEKSIAQIASENSLHPKQIQRWRDQLLSEGESVFAHKSSLKREDPDKEKLLLAIDQLNLELDFIKKKLKKNL